MRVLEISALLYYNGCSKKSTSGWSLRLVRGGIDIRFWSADHNLDHLQVWTTWELWTLRYKKARLSDEKARKSTQNEAKNRCFCVWDQDGAGSIPVTPTTGSAGSQYRVSSLLIFIHHAIALLLTRSYIRKRDPRHITNALRMKY